MTALKCFPFISTPLSCVYWVARSCFVYLRFIPLKITHSSIARCVYYESNVTLATNWMNNAHTCTKSANQMASITQLSYDAVLTIIVHNWSRNPTNIYLFFIRNLSCHKNSVFKSIYTKEWWKKIQQKMKKKNQHGAQ